MGVKGFQGTSLLDYPGRIAALVFYGGCNLVCPFCHNPTLVIDHDQYPDYPDEELLADLESRKGFIDGVVITGGEPLCQPDLSTFLRKVKELGLLIKIDTNGLFPSRLEQLVEDGLVDYLAIDIKTSPNRYDELGGDTDAADLLQRTVDLVKRQAVPHEFRTTCVPGLVDNRDIENIGQLIAGSQRWYLQQFGKQVVLTEEELPEPYSVERLQELESVAAKYNTTVSIRGLD